MTADKAENKSDSKSKTSTGGNADKKLGETESTTINPEAQKRVIKSYREGWERIWRKKR